ncbi:LOW QUALITY PROTEIN: telomerase Cajal body protein 1 homolog [Drosophila eugracilis]|uniref:LOW QUALITY PROTEIN: telomerase Cajal body protein 1 homolog n=1 Tax=Drosophila eugracilis TaxID=29029 RepID=UPI001BDA6841|nr:LOW QUALITY PROTEIN: telomerase Cajal body protein 1 homolog [Drosophila eugracilis]
MEDSINLSTSMCDGEASLLNHNVSFSSTMVTSSLDHSVPKLSVTLSDAEILRLRLRQPVNGSTSLDATAPLESNQGDGTLQEDETESERVIDIEDTLEITADKSQVGAGDQEPSWVAPLEYFGSKIVELGRRTWSSSAKAQQYTKGCYWSPDGTCLLVPVHFDGMHVMELPTDLYSEPTVQETRPLTKLQSAVHVPEGGTVYDCVWFPHMNSQQPETCFWLATRQHEPIHMWDAFDGSLRCSYSGYDAVDEVMAAISLAFSHDGQRVYAGYKRCIKIFNTSRPGRISDDYPVKFAISCIAQTSEHPNTLTCGNWHGYIQHFDLRCSQRLGPLFTLGGHKGGITQLRYGENGSGEWNLFSGARKCGKILQWDMRNYKKPVVEFQRHVDTNQRVQFDFTPDRRWLASGDTRGAVNVWNLQELGEASVLPLHSDCCNGVGLNPVIPILATSSGQYHFTDRNTHRDTLKDSKIAEQETTDDPNPDQLEVIYENAVIMWWCGQGASE